MIFSIIGGDLRLSKLAEMMTDDGKEVYTYAMENSEEILKNKKIIQCDTLDEAIEKGDVIICSIPFLKTDGTIYTTFSDKKIAIEDLCKKKDMNKIFIAGSISESVKNILEKSYKAVIDIMKQEELVILNTIATAEGAIEVAIQNTDTVLHGSKVLVLGFGRVAKVVAQKFKNLSTEVTCAARKDTDLAWIKAMGYKAVNINFLGEDLKQYDIIINTVPKMIIDKNEMQYMNKNVLLIDLASVPGGISAEDASKLDLKFVWALALPGKVAPVTSAEFIKETIYNVLN